MNLALLHCTICSACLSAFAYFGDDDNTKETEQFVRTFDRFFDMMNTRYLEEGTQRIKPDLDPYREKDDRWLFWSE